MEWRKGKIVTTEQVQRWLDDYRKAWETRDADAAAALFTLLKIDPLFQGIALGAIILLAVGFDAWSRLRRR